MSVLVFIDQSQGNIKKASFEVLSYGAKLANMLGTAAEGIVFGTVNDDLSTLGRFGVTRIYHVNNELLNAMDSQVFADLMAQAVTKTGADTVIFSHNVDGKSIAPRLSAKLKAGLVAGATALPDISNGFVVRKNVFSGKAIADVAIKTPIRIISLNPNAYKAVEMGGHAEVATLDLTVMPSRIKVKEVKKIVGEVPLTEAEIVVSGGRGLKGPENWGLVEDLARALGAATACSRPVADSHWRPHHEHVGQTGFAIAPNLYVALGISGAIQHLAGVNRSKVIVVVNKDPEAPFFKAADYGIVGDVFEVAPKLTAAVKKLKGQ